MRVTKFSLLLAAAGAVLLPAAGLAADYLGDGKRSLQAGDMRAAQIQLRNAVRSDPQDAEAHLQLARVSLELGDWGAAEREAKAARERGYDPHAILTVLARSYMAQGRFRDILDQFTVGNQDPLLDADVLVARGYAQAAMGRSEEAEASFAQARILSPRSSRPLVASARVAAGRNDLAAAVQDADAALAVDPNSSEILVLKSQLLRARGDGAGAMLAADDAVKVAPGAVAARIQRASLLIAAGKGDAAKQDVTSALASAPNSAQALYLQAVLFVQARDYKAADAVLAGMSSVMPSIPRAYFVQALVKRGLQQLEQAEDAAARYVARAPDDVEGAKLLAGLQLQKREAEAAIATLSEATAHGRADQQTYELLAQAYAQAGKQDEAVRSLEKAAALAPDGVEMRNRLAAARMKAGETDAAIADLEASLAIAPAQPATGAALFLAELSTGDLDRAAAAFERVRAAQGYTKAVRNLDGLLKMAQLDFMEARAIFRSISEDDPNFVPAKTNLARIAIMQGHPDDAGKLISEILAKDPDAEPALSMDQSLLLQQGKIKDAIAALERAHQQAPADPRPTLALAGLYQRQGDNKRALALLAPAGTTADQPLALLAARAQLLGGQGRVPEARETWRALLARAPAALDARLQLIGALTQAGDYEGARSLVQEGLRLAPRNYQLLSAYPAIDLKAAGLEAALATADRLQRQNQDFAPARALRGDVYMEAQRYEDAARAYAEAADRAPSQMLALRRSQALSRSGRPDEAEAILRQWVAQNPDDLAALKSLASLESDAARYGEAAAHLEAAIGRNPQDAIALNNLAWIYQRLGDGRARATAQKAYLLLPSQATADTLGWILVSAGDTDKGLMLLRQANANGVAEPSVRYHYAAALARAGQREQAVKLLAPVLAEHPDFAEREDAQRLLRDLSSSG